MDVACEHEEFVGDMKFNRIRGDDGNIIGYSCDISGKCAKCGAHAYWIGLPGGLAPDQPMVSADGTEMRAPFSMAKDVVQFGSSSAIQQKIEVSVVRAPRPPA